MQKKVAIVIPFYQDTISALEIISLKQCEDVLFAYPKIAIKPKSLTLPSEAKNVAFSDIINFEDIFFKGISGYNQLMLSSQFYKQFIDYEYILIYQLDAFVFKDELTYWCNQDFDYIGAPWIRKTNDKNAIKKFLVKCQQQLSTKLNLKKRGLPNKYQFENKVGNGGFSLRRVKKFYGLTLSMQSSINYYLSKTGYQYNEDAFWSIEVNRKNQILNIPSYKTGLRFAFEVNPEKAYNLNKKNLPFGCHDWDAYLDFWRPFFELHNYSI